MSLFDPKVMFGAAAAFTLIALLDSVSSSGGNVTLRTWLGVGVMVTMALAFMQLGSA
jgi:hypothetical protein